MSQILSPDAGRSNNFCQKIRNISEKIYPRINTKEPKLVEDFRFPKKANHMLLVVTQANEYCFRGTVTDITDYDSNHIRVSGTIAGDGTFDATASKTNDPNIWTLTNNW